MENIINPPFIQPGRIYNPLNYGYKFNGSIDYSTASQALIILIQTAVGGIIV